MTITPEQADRMKRDATDGPWFVHTDPGDVDGTYIHDNTGNMCVAIEHVGSDYRPADLELIAAAPDLAQTVIDQAKRIEELEAQLAGMTWQTGVHAGDEDIWAETPEEEELSIMAAKRPDVHLIRRLVGPAEVAE